MATKNKKPQAPPEKQKQVHYQIKMSHECEKCMNCSNGIKYVQNMIPGKAYNGVVCKKGK